MHQIRFPLGLHSRPSIAGFKAPTSKGREAKIERRGRMESGGKMRALLLYERGKKEVDRREGREEEGICRTNVTASYAPAFFSSIGQDLGSEKSFWKKVVSLCRCLCTKKQMLRLQEEDPMHNSHRLCSVNDVAYVTSELTNHDMKLNVDLYYTLPNK